MSLLGGFDVLIELSPEFLTDTVKSSLKIANKPALTPFQIGPITFTKTIGSVTLNLAADLIFTELHVVCAPPDILTVELKFDRSSVYLDKSTYGICGLDGTISIALTPTITQPPPAPRQQALPPAQIEFDPSGAIVKTSLSSAAQTIIGQQLTALENLIQLETHQNVSYTRAQFIADLSAEVGAFVQKLGPASADVPLSIKSGNDGTLSPFVVEDLKLHCISATNPDENELGLFATAFVANHGKGDPTTKTGLSIPSGDSLAVTMSPQVFHEWVFCPSVVDALVPNHGTAVTPNQLPPSCGTAQSIPYSAKLADGSIQVVDVSKLADTFENGRIDVEFVGSFDEGPCITVNLDLHAPLTILPIGTGVSVSCITDSTNVEVDYNGWCIAAGGFFLAGALGWIANTFVDQFGTKCIQNRVTSAVANSFLFAGSQSGLGPGNLDSVEVTAEGLTLGMYVPPIYQGTTDPVPNVLITHMVSPTSAMESPTKTFNFNITCAQGVYPYQILWQDERAIVTLHPYFLTPPVEVEWSVAGIQQTANVLVQTGPSVVINGQGGDIKLLKTSCTYVEPLPYGITLELDVPLTVTESDSNELTLDSNRGYGCFSVNVVANLTDCLQQKLSIMDQVDFNGDVFQPGGTFTADVNACMTKLVQKYRQETLMNNPSWSLVSTFPPIDHPPIEELEGYARSLIGDRSQAADEMLQTALLVHGNSLRLALRRIIGASFSGLAGLGETRGEE